jgi:hypothetical protein
MTTVNLLYMRANFNLLIVMNISEYIFLNAVGSMKHGSTYVLKCVTSKYSAFLRVNDCMRYATYVIHSQKDVVQLYACILVVYILLAFNFSVKDALWLRKFLLYSHRSCRYLRKVGTDLARSIRIIALHYYGISAVSASWFLGGWTPLIIAANQR